MQEHKHEAAGAVLWDRNCWWQEDDPDQEHDSRIESLGSQRALCALALLDSQAQKPEHQVGEVCSLGELRGGAIQASLKRRADPKQKVRTTQPEEQLEGHEEPFSSGKSPHGVKGAKPQISSWSKV